MPDEITLDELRAIAQRAGLNLAEDELQRLLPGIQRARKQAAELRTLLTDNCEPANAFSATKK